MKLILNPPLINSLLCTLITIFIFSFQGLSTEKTDSLLIELSQTNSKLKKVEILKKLGDEYVWIDKNKTVKYYKKGLQLINQVLAEKHSNIKSITLKTEILSGLSFIYYWNKKYEKAILILEESISISKANNIKEKPDYLLYLSYCYFKLNDYKSAINYANELLTLSELDAIELEAHFFLAEVYNRIEVYDLSVFHLNKCLVNSYINETTGTEINVRNRLIDLTQEQGKWKDAKKMLKTLRSLIKNKNSKNTIGYFALKGRSHMHFGDLDSAKYYLDLGENSGKTETLEKRVFVIDLMRVYEYRTKFEIAIKNYDKALIYVDKLEKMAVKYNFLKEQINSCELKYIIYEKNNDYRKAFLAQKKYNILKEKNKLENVKGLLLKQEFELKSKQNRIKDSIAYQLVDQKRINELKNHKIILIQERNTKYFLLVLLGSSFISLFLFIRSFKRNKKNNGIISLQKLEARKSQVVLANQNKKLLLESSLYKILKVCSKDLPIKIILQKVLTYLLDLNSTFESSKGYIYLETEGVNNGIETSIGLTETELKIYKNTLDHECICGEVYNEHKVELCCNKHLQNHFNIPILSNQEVLGIIILFTNHTADEMKRKIHFLEVVANLLGETIYRHNTVDKLRLAHLENILQKKEVENVNKKIALSLNMQEAINGLMGAIINNENIGEKVYNYLTEVFDKVKVKRLNITLFNFETNMVNYYFLREDGVDTSTNKTFPISDFSLETIEILKTNKKIIEDSIKDKKEKSISDKKMIQSNINSFISYPLMSKNELLGALNICFEEKTYLTETQNELLNMLIEGITIAIKQNLMFNKITLANTKLSRLQNELNSSLNYSKKIQTAILPTEEKFNSIFPKKFSILLQKDIVGGDFYWVRQYTNGIKMLACVDCTGHNVPGAFMTMLARVLLRESATIKGLKNPGDILMQMDIAVRRLLNQTNYSAMQDGMDMTIFVLDENNNKIDFSSAQRPIVIQQKSHNKLSIIKGSKFGVGGYLENKKHFEVLSFNLDEIEKIYMFSDGYPDQFGGPKVKKIGTKKLIQSLELIKNLPMEKQKEFLINEFNTWKGKLEQIDDVCIIGIDLT